MKFEIDREYPGKESVVKNLLLEMLSLDFELNAYAVAIRKLKAGRILSLKEILRKIKMTEVGKRLKDA